MLADVNSLLSFILHAGEQRGVKASPIDCHIWHRSLCVNSCYVSAQGGTPSWVLGILPGI